MIQSSSFLEKVLISFSWPEIAKQSKKIEIDEESILSRFLQSLSYSEHGVKQTAKKKAKLDPDFEKISFELGKLWDRAHIAMRQNKLVVAKNALFKIIDIDSYNAAAYNRLGIVYAKWRKYDESIDYFRLAVKFEPTASSCHNLALIYYETKDYRSSVKYFRKALKYDNKLAARYIALAKVYEKLQDQNQVLRNLEVAARLEPSKETKKLLYISYRTYGLEDKASQVEKQMLDSLKQDVKEVSALEHKALVDKNILSSDAALAYQYQL